MLTVNLPKLSDRQMKEIDENVTKSKIRLILAEPFFATMLLSQKVIDNTEIESMAINGKEIFYSPAYIEKLTVDEIKAKLCSCTLKVAHLHHTRRNGRDQKQWNKATEYAVNSIVKNAGFHLPAGSLIDDRYNNLSAEQIFTLLPGEDEQDPNGQPKPQPGTQPGQGNGNQQTPGPGVIEVQDSTAKTEQDRQQEEGQIKQTLAQAKQIGKKAGKLPGFIEEMINDILEPKVNWHEVLSRFVHDIARNDYSFNRPNPRFIQSGFYLPSLHNEETGKLILLVDSSCSVDDELLKQFGGETADLCNEIKSLLTIIYVDTKVQGEPVEVEPGDNVKFEARGRGGTDFAPGFDYIKEHDIEAKAIIYLTDGECHSYPDEEPESPVLWVQYGNYKGFQPPFGEVVKLN